MSLQPTWDTFHGYYIGRWFPLEFWISPTVGRFQNLTTEVFTSANGSCENLEIFVVGKSWPVFWNNHKLVVVFLLRGRAGWFGPYIWCTGSFLLCQNVLLCPPTKSTFVAGGRMRRDRCKHPSCRTGNLLGILEKPVEFGCADKLVNWNPHGGYTQ